jgi:amino acid transporter
MENRTKEIFMYSLAALIVICIVLFIILLVFMPLPEVNSHMLDIALGALLAAFSTVVGYFFGSSKGSSEKTQILSDMKK